MKELTSSVYTFEKLIKGNFLYIDKTEYIWKLIRPATGMYFMSRPRRFGKSLTVSTLEAVFSGQKELFKGLSIYNKDYDWKKYPIIHLDMGNCDARSPGSLRKYLGRLLETQAAEHNINIQIQEDEIAASFEALIRAIAMQEQVVILIDEYDKPILGNATNPCVREILDVLKGFYSAIKKCEPCERFVFLTGVSKFTHVSVFSDLNNLTDITMNADYACMMGYTQEELEAYFAGQIDALEKQLAIPRDELLGKIRNWYNGYRFHANAETVYNPVSIAQFFTNNGEFNNYWFSTGTPTFLLDLIKKTNFDFENALTRPVSSIAFDAYEIDKLEPLPLLLQTGYLTIKSAFRDFGATFYNLDFPNFEVRSAFDTYLMNAYTRVSKEDVENAAINLARRVRSGDVDGFMKNLNTFLAAIPYDIQIEQEKYYQTVFFQLFLMVGVYIEAEARTNNGRIDAVAAYNEWVFIFEFKINRNAEAALSQIREKEYYRKYQHSGKKIVLIGANFDTGNRQLDDWKQEKVNAE